jgi:predicted RNA binding protein YcfA (HicA-like mRNA interferase family)
MASLPSVSGDRAVKAFQKAGWFKDRQHGSHIILNVKVTTRDIFDPVFWICGHPSGDALAPPPIGSQAHSGIMSRKLLI